MIRVRVPGRVVGAGALLLLLSGCGVRGPLEAPPAAGTPARQGQVQAGGAVRPADGVPGADEDETPDTAGLVRQPVPSAQPGTTTGGRRGFTVPKDPFVLDPLL
jgi:predicted small lipoprotein YifL